MSDTDMQLLARYTRHHDEDAFAEMVHRHLDLVFSAALRQVRSRHLAEDVAQATFTDLARNAHRLAPDTILTAWLYQVTRRTAIDVVRRESRRQLREQIATEMNAMNATADDWAHVAPLLDEAMQALDETDRAAVLLRYFENKSLREVGQALGTTDDTAQKRVSRAVERLRTFFAQRGLTVGASSLAIVLSANAIQAAPVGLAVTISTAAALGGTTIASTATATAIKTIAMTTLQKTLITATVAVLAGAGIYETRQASSLRREVQTFQQQQAPLTDEVAQLKAENERLAKLLANSEQPSQGRQEHLELLKLRGEVARLRQQAGELETLRKEKAPLRTGLAAAKNQTADSALDSLRLADSNRVAAAKAVIFNAAAGVTNKLEALGILRSTGARSDDVVKQMIQAYYATDNPKWRADIFRQLSGVTTAELKQPLLEAVRDTNQHTDIRQEAAETLAHYLPDPDAKAWLEHLAANDADERVRAEAARRLQTYQRRHGQ